jgi:hypothetical protein
MDSEERTLIALLSEDDASATYISYHLVPKDQDPGSFAGKLIRGMMARRVQIDFKTIHVYPEGSNV